MSSMKAVPVLMYHEVADAASIDALSSRIQRGYVSTLEEFEVQIRALHERGFEFLGMARLVAALAAGTLPPKAVVVTFDDGFEGNFVHARPILRRYGATATFFVVTNKVGDPAMMNWQQLRTLADEGFEVQSHTANHPLLSTLDAEATRLELETSKAAIEASIGRPCCYLSLPNGDSNAHLSALATRAGYLSVCNSHFGYVEPGADPLALDRIAVKNGVSLERFCAMVERQPALVRRMRTTARVKKTVAAVLGKRLYDRLYNAYFGVAELDRRKQP